MTKNLLWSFAILAGCVVLGCNKKGTPEASATVSGKVTNADGSPIPGGNINFRSTVAKHRASTGEIQADGTYTAKDVPQGECIVYVDNAFLKQSKAAGGYQLPDGATKGAPGAKYVEIKKKYTSEAESDLKVNVSEDPFKYDVQLK